MSMKALDELCKSVSNQGNGKLPANLFKRLSSMLNLLASQKHLQPYVISECNELFSNHMVALYGLQPALALKVTVSIITEVFKSRLTPLLKLEPTKDNSQLVKIYEEVLRRIFNGIQNHLERHKPDLEQIGSALYKPLLGILGSTLGLKLSARIRAQAYGLISDTAEGSGPNKLLLKNKTILGGIRLGSTMASTNDYLVLDTLLLLLARITPSAHDVKRRTKLAKDVFQSAKMLKTLGKMACDKLSSLLQNATGDQWETISDRIIEMLAKVDSQKPQPFVLTSREIHATSSVFTHPEFLDKIYLDSEGFIVNVQEGDAVDCLEVDYVSVTSIQIQEMPQDSLSITLSLSSPPMKGFEPLMSTSDFHSVAFFISSSQMVNFKRALQNRKMGAIIKHKPDALSKTKSSVVDALNLNGFHSLEGKPQKIEKFYESSVIASPDHALNDDDEVVETGVASIMGNICKADLIPENKPPQEKSKIISSEQLEGQSRPQMPRIMANKCVAELPVLKNQVTILGGDLSDLESLSVSDFAAIRKTAQPKDVLLIQEQKRKTKNEIVMTSDVPVPDIQPGEDKTPLNKRSSFSATLKRKRDKAIDGSEESGLDIDKASRSLFLYNSQLLRPAETATARSTTKYKSRAGKSSPALSPGIDFDKLPMISTPLTLKPGPTLGLRGKAPLRLVKQKAPAVKSEFVSALAKTNPVESNKLIKKKREASVEVEMVTSRRPRRATKRLKVIESDSGHEDGDVQLVAAAIKAEVSTIPTGKDVSSKHLFIPTMAVPQKQKEPENSKKFKKAPWKNIDQLALHTVGSMADVSVISSVSAKPKPNIKPKPKEKENNKLSELPTMNKLLPSIAADFVCCASKAIDARPSSLLPSQSVVTIQSLEPDIAIAQAESIGMDIDIDIPFDYSDSAAILTTTSNDPLDESSGQHEIPAVTSYVERTKLVREVPKKSTSQGLIHINLPLSVRSSSPAIALPPKSILRKPVETVDLIHLDDSKQNSSEGMPSNVDVFKANSNPDLPHEASVAIWKPTSAPTVESTNFSSHEQRLGVTFAANTKYQRSPCQSPRSRIGLKPVKFASDIPSMIPRLVVKREGKENVSVTPSKMKKMQKFEVPRDLRKMHIHGRYKIRKGICVAADYEDDHEDEIEPEVSPDEKIVIVLNEIQGIILDNLSRKFNAAAANARNATNSLRSFAAEEIRKMLEDSIEHRNSLVHLEAEYANYGRQLQQGFEEIGRVNEDIDKRLRQAIIDHDQKGLMRIMPKKFAARPKIFQTLAASNST